MRYKHQQVHARRNNNFSSNSNDIVSIVATRAKYDSFIQTRVTSAVTNETSVSNVEQHK